MITAMVQMSRATKLKLMPPILYLGLSVLLFIVTWPTFAEVRHVIGASVTLFAFLLWITARVQLGNAFSLAPKASALVTTGIYRKLRHPVYYFSIMALGGLSIYIWKWPMCIALLVLIALELFRIRSEETVLTKRFGDVYLEYKNSTWF